MKKLILFVMLFAALTCFAGTKPDPASFTIDVHVTASNRSGRLEQLNAVIDGKNVVIAIYSDDTGIKNTVATLPPGHYKARIEDQGTSKKGRISVVYSILMADGTADQYGLIGMSE